MWKIQSALPISDFPIGVEILREDTTVGIDASVHSGTKFELVVHHIYFRKQHNYSPGKKAP